MLECKLLESLTFPHMKTLMKMMELMMNELRKYRIAMGLFNEADIPEAERKNFLISNIELREKIKSNHQMMINMQEI